MKTTKALGKTQQISIQSHPGILPRLEKIAAGFAERGEKWRGKKVRAGQIINGLILLLLDSDDPIQFAREALGKLETWSIEGGHDEPGELPPDKGHKMTDLPKLESDKKRGNRPK
jgi:hypothetical protein